MGDHPPRLVDRRFPPPLAFGVSCRRRPPAGSRMILRRLLAGFLLTAAAGCARAPRPVVAPSVASSAALDSAGIAAPFVRALVARARAARTLRGRAEIALSAADWEGSTEAEAAILVEA